MLTLLPTIVHSQARAPPPAADPEAVRAEMLFGIAEELRAEEGGGGRGGMVAS
jgi:hypothetical protein